jgi:hypothetical protein
MAEDSPTRRTVLIAGAANLFVGVIKLAAGRSAPAGHDHPWGFAR